ncbi:hypothetical protein Q5752_000342 [Cryptotrichosporon argae]
MAEPTIDPPAMLTDAPAPLDAPSPAVAPPPPARWRPTLLRVLTHTQTASAAVFAVFTAAHLASPLAAALGGIRAADKTMMLAREYYLPLEPLAVLAPLYLHLTSSLLRRALLSLRYLLALLALPHTHMHRTLPRGAAPPIARLSPAEWGYDFVGYAASTRVWMRAGYVVLAGVGAYHAGVGAMKVVARLRVRAVPDAADAAARADADQAQRQTPTTRRGKSRSRQAVLAAVVGGLAALVAQGLARIAREASAGPALQRRYEAVFAAAPWARIGLR